MFSVMLLLHKIKCNISDNLFPALSDAVNSPPFLRLLVTQSNILRNEIVNRSEMRG